MQRVAFIAGLTLALSAQLPSASARNPAAAPAEPPHVASAAPPQLTRTLRTFDFEERDRGNVEETPAGWLKVEGPGLPHYLHGQFDTTVSAAGRASFRFDLNGGSVTYRYPAGLIRVMPHASYRVTAMCRTTPLKGARARLTAYLCDEDGHALTDSIRSSEPFSNAAGDETFHRLGFDVIADEPTAASLVLELALLQPAMLPNDVLGAQTLPVEDIHGSAWFDDVHVAQVPDVSIYSDRSTNVFAPGEPINIRVRVRDRIANDLSCELRVFDVDGKPVHQRTGALDFSNANAAEGEPLMGNVSLPRLAPGWYEAKLTLRSHDQFVGEQTLKLVQLGDAPGPTQADPRFGVVATTLAPDVWDVVPDMIDAVAAGRVKLSAWTGKYAIENNGAAAFDRLLDALKGRGVAITACLSALPPELCKAIGGDQWTDLLRVPNYRWQPQLAYLIARHATHLTQWQLMDDEAANGYAAKRTDRAVFARVFDEFSKLIGTPDLAMPWPAMFDLDSDVSPAASIALSVPGDILPEQLPLYLHDAAARSNRPASVTLHPIDANRYGRPVQLRDLALRVAYALAGGAERIELPMPMTAKRLREGAAIAEPDKLLIPERVILSTLANGRFAGKVSIAPGIDAFLFDRGGSGVMLVSTPSQAPMPPPMRVTVALGKRATMIDLDGNVTPLAHTADRKRPDDFDIPVGPMPFFVTDIDAPLMLLRASIAIDNPMLESSVTPVGRTLSFTNTFDSPITGTIHATGPAGWTISMGAAMFSLNPGETFHAPISMQFPLNASAGEKSLAVDLRIQGRDDYRLGVPVSVKLGLSDVGLQTLAVRSGDEIIVQQTITNYGNTPINYNAFVSVAGLPRQERIVSALPPGKTTIRKYRLALPQNANVTRLRSGVREMEGKRMLNDEVEIR